jgi:hypothetical protein
MAGRAGKRAVVPSMDVVGYIYKEENHQPSTYTLDLIFFINILATN